ncbi:MAG: serine/threonine protein kinase, partial [Planctomycetota bacterium]
MNDLCSIELLRNAVARVLSADEEATLHAHLEHCEACCAQMEQLAGGDAWQLEAASLLSTDELDATVPDAAAWSEVDFSVEHLDPSDDANVLVLKAFDRELKRYVAIKVLAPHLAHSSVARKRFAREAQAAAAVVNPHVIAIHHVQPTGRLPFLIMPLLTGESLAQRLKARGPLELTEVLRIGMQAAAGLAAAHDQGLVHRDVKPANIFLEKGVERVVITDFGLARAADDVSMTRQGVVAGTPEYMSPEQARGEALDGRSDLFSLGCVLYEMATGVSPFRTDSTIATLRRIVDEQPAAIASLAPELPPWFSRIVERLLSKDGAQRFASASEVSQLLEQCLSHLQQPTSVPLPASLVPHAVGRRSMFKVTRKGVFAMLGTIGMALLGMVLLQPTEAPDISGQWTSEEWGTVVLEAKQPGQYEGTFTGSGKNAIRSSDRPVSGTDKLPGSIKIDVPALGPNPTDKDKSGTLNFHVGIAREGDDKDKSGTLHLKWSRAERRFNGTWKVGDDRKGKISLRLVGDVIRGALKTAKSAEKESDSPRLGDFAWKRSPPAQEGRVTIQTIPGSDVIVLKGTKADVEATEAALSRQDSKAATTSGDGSSPRIVVDESLEGVWGLALPPEIAAKCPEEQRLRWVIASGWQGRFQGDQRLSASRLKVEPQHTPKRLSFVDGEGKPMRGIYEVKEDGLRLSIAPETEALPTKFGTDPEFKRVKGKLAEAQLAALKLYSTKAATTKHTTPESTVPAESTVPGTLSDSPESSKTRSQPLDRETEKGVPVDWSFNNPGTLTKTQPHESRIPVRAKLLVVKRDWSNAGDKKPQDGIRKSLSELPDTPVSRAARAQLAEAGSLGPDDIVSNLGLPSVFGAEDFASLQSWLRDQRLLLGELPVEQKAEPRFTAEMHPASTRPDDQGIFRVVNHPYYLARINISRTQQVMEREPGGPHLRGAALSKQPKFSFYLPKKRVVAIDWDAPFTGKAAQLNEPLGSKVILIFEDAEVPEPRSTVAGFRLPERIGSLYLVDEGRWLSPPGDLAAIDHAAAKVAPSARHPLLVSERDMHSPIEFRIAATKADREADGVAWFPIMEPRTPAPAGKSGANVPIE